jgi:L-fucose mutarotase/ribose pyranase (RbsD/FucU family)
MVLKGIPAVLSPELLYALAKMGHGDELGRPAWFLHVFPL